MSKRFPDTATAELASATAAIPAASGRERRQYYRLNSVLPIELQLFGGPTPRLWLSEVLQGYTQDVGEGGLCVQLFRLSSEQLRWLQDRELRVQLTIHLPPFRNPVKAVGRMAWMEAMPGHGQGYRVGLAFETIEDVDRLRMLRYARRVHWLPRLATVSFAVLMATVGSLSWHARANANARRVLTTQVHALGARETALREQLATVESRRKHLEVQVRETAQQAAEEAARGEKAVVAAAPIPQAAPAPAAETAQSALKELAQEDVKLQEELRAVTTAKAAAEAELLNNLYNWLRVHQYPTTGLLISYEGDSSLEDWAFTYDQALMAQCFLLFGDTAGASKILDFFAAKAQRVDGGFVNAYDAVSGNIREYAVHAGPNLWIGIAALQYTHATGDQRYVPLATFIAAWIEQLQRQDPEGGLRGGPRETWFSTEHNLDAYAFFTMLAQVTGDERYRRDADRVMQWLTRNAHGRLEGQLNRGRGDATIATDTFAWSIAALGPSGLVAMGFDPDKILAFAEEHCAVKTIVAQPGKGRVSVEGFDFSKPKHVARGGIISTEWTAQMIVAMKMMAHYHQAAGRLEEAETYRAKAAHYEEELAKLIISSPCPLGHAGWALPYASQGNVDTGHGWRTVHGATTGSTSGTVYSLFARLGFNPLQLDGPPRRAVASTADAASTHRP